MFDFFSCCNVHGSWKRIVGGLPFVDMIVGVDRGFASEDTSCVFDGSIGDDFVCVHIGLCPGSGLPNPKWEMSIKIPLHDFLARINDPVSDFPVKDAKVSICSCCCNLEDTKSTNQRTWHNIFTNVEIDQRTCSLTAIVGITRHLHFPHRIGFNSKVFIGLRRSWSCFSCPFVVCALVIQPIPNGLNNPCTPTFFTKTRPTVEFLSDILRYADRDDSAVSNVVFPHD